MIVTAALIWYNERPEDLAACVRGMATIADRLVAVDGAYRRYPDASITSPPEQALAIQDAAREAGLECSVHTPAELWAGQVEKRTFCLGEAQRGSDWIAVVDADWVISGDRAAARAALAELRPSVDVMTAELYTPPGKRMATGWHRAEAGKRYQIPHLFRALPEFRVEGLHWQYSAMRHQRRVWMWHAPDPNRPCVLQRPLPPPYEIEHRTLHRTKKQILDSRAFCNDRELVLKLTGQEDDQPGLPPPVFDYATIPYR